MSTKIYNGYRMANLSAKQILDFFFELREREKNYFYEELAASVIDNIRWFIMDVVICDFRLGCSIVDGKLTEQGEELYFNMMKKYILYFFDTSNDMTRFKCIAENTSLEQRFDAIMDDFTNWSLLRAFVEKTSVQSDINRLDYVSNKMTFHPMNNRWIGIMAFGVAENFLDKLLASKTQEDVEFVKKYKLEEYGYWNNSDKPDNVSSRSWKHRRKLWDVALPGIGVPIDCGLVGDFSTTETTSMFNRELLSTVEKLAKPYDEEFIGKICDILSNKFSYDLKEARSFVESAIPSVQKLEQYAATLDNVEDVHQRALYIGYTMNPLVFAPNLLKILNERYPDNSVSKTVNKELSKLKEGDKND